MEEYILIFHDNRELYLDVVVKVKNLGNKTQDELYKYYNSNANETIKNIYGLEDGLWGLNYISRLDDIEIIDI